MSNIFFRIDEIYDDEIPFERFLELIRQGRIKSTGESDIKVEFIRDDQKRLFFCIEGGVDCKHFLVALKALEDQNVEEGKEAVNIVSPEESDALLEHL